MNKQIESINIEATAGALVPKLENGYIISNKSNIEYLSKNSTL